MPECETCAWLRARPNVEIANKMLAAHTLKFHSADPEWVEHQRKQREEAPK